jgi:hypothetical protein
MLRKPLYLLLAVMGLPFVLPLIAICWLQDQLLPRTGLREKKGNL